jgi:hypothetical protein
MSDKKELTDDDVNFYRINCMCACVRDCKYPVLAQFNLTPTDIICGCLYNSTSGKILLDEIPGKTYKAVVCGKCRYEYLQAKRTANIEKSLNTISLALKYIVNRMDRNDLVNNMETLMETIEKDNEGIRPANAGIEGIRAEVDDKKE